MKKSWIRHLTYGMTILGLLALLVGFLLTRNEMTSREDLPPDRITLLCGAALRPPMEEITEAFQRRHEVNVEVRYGASNLLLGQLELTGQGDVFLPGDAYYTDEAKRRGWVADQQAVAWFTPVIMVGRGNPKRIRTVNDLAAPGIRLALADSRSAAIGRITPIIFEMNNVSMKTVEDNTVFTSVTAPELGQAITLGHADAAIIWRPVARMFALAEEIEIPAEFNLASPIVAAVLTGATNPEQARSFVEFLRGATARAILERHHYDLDIE